MAHNILLTGASGYLGGTLLARWNDASLPSYSKLCVLVRTENQAAKVQTYGANPIICDISDHSAIFKHIIDKEISIIYYLIDALTADHQPNMIQALGEVKRLSGREVHFLNTTGAKHFSSDAGVPFDSPILDTDPRLYDIQKNSRPALDLFAQALKGSVTVLDTAEAHGVRAYIFAPCIVYGRGEGFGNQTSIQDVAIVKAARGARRVYNVNSATTAATWPVSHISDTTNLYLQIMRKILSGDDIGYGKNGYYLAASGSLAWDDIYHVFAKALAKRGIVEDERVFQADDAALNKMGEALGVPSPLVRILVGGRCIFTAKRGFEIGWKPEYSPENFLETADEEVDMIFRSLEVET